MAAAAACLVGEVFVEETQSNTTGNRWLEHCSLEGVVGTESVRAH